MQTAPLQNWDQKRILRGTLKEIQNLNEEFCVLTLVFYLLELN